MLRKATDVLCAFKILVTFILTSVYISVSCTERVHLHPRGPGRYSDRERLLGALLPGARHRPRWRLPGGTCRTQLPRRLLQHVLQPWQFRAPCSTSHLCGPGAHSGRWALVCRCLLSLSLPFITFPFLLLCVNLLWERLHPHGSCDPSSWFPGNKCLGGSFTFYSIVANIYRVCWINSKIILEWVINWF